MKRNIKFHAYIEKKQYEALKDQNINMSGTIREKLLELVENDEKLNLIEKICERDNKKVCILLNPEERDKIFNYCRKEKTLIHLIVDNIINKLNLKTS